MTKLTMLRGLPASGKSTRAKEIVEQGNSVRVNKDLLRKMLHFDKWNGRNEGITFEAEQMLVHNLLTQGMSVVVDDTNFNLEDSWKRIAEKSEANFVVEDVALSVSDCIARDAKRGSDAVGVDVIMRMALENGLYPKPEKGFVLCDLDGTLANIEHRLQYAKGEQKDWGTFFALIRLDKVRDEVYMQILEKQYEGYEVILVSARPDTYRTVTRDWLDLYSPALKYKTLIMRRGGDKRPDTMVKQEIYDRYFKGKYDIYCIYDDRPSVIRMWRSNNLEVVDVGDGIEF